MYPNRGGTGTPMSSTTRALSDGRGTPQLAQHMAGSVWGVAAGATAFGGQGGVGYYQKAGQAQAGTGVASVGAGGAPAVTGQQSAQSDLHVPIKKWVKKWEGSKYTPQMIGLTPTSVNITRTKADADALRLYRWVRTNEVVSEGQDAEGEKEEEGEQDQANDIVGNLEAQADQKEGDGDESMEEDGGSDGGDGEGADAEA